MKYNGDDNKSGFWEQEKSRLEDKLVNKIFKCLIRFLIEVIVMTVLIVGINIFMNGMYLWGLPRINDIQSVDITYPSVTDDVKEMYSFRLPSVVPYADYYHKEKNFHLQFQESQNLIQNMTTHFLI